MGLRLTSLALASALFSPANAETGFNRQGDEYPIAGLLLGEQVYPGINASQGSGYVVWQDNATDGDGHGIRARRLTSSMLGNLSPFRVNENGAGDQEQAKVATLKNGGAVFVWQGGALGEQDIFARFMAPDGTFLTGDVRVNSFTEGVQIQPAVTVTSDGNVVVVWSSFGQDGSMQGVFGQWLSASGQKVGGEFPVNQYTRFNQRTPAVAALANGEFVVAWVSEQKRFEGSVDIYARILGGSRSSASTELLVNTSTNLCANPVISAAVGGGFMVAWSQRDPADLNNAWDVFARTFNSDGQGTSEAVKVNTHTSGNHFAPQVAAVGDNHLIVWTSLEQDGSGQGVFGRFATSNLQFTSAEFQVNSSTSSDQIHPAVASDGASQFVVVWTSFVGGVNTFDLLAQRFAPAPVRPEAPFVSAISSTKLSVAWPDASSQSVAGYELYIDDGASPVLVAGNVWTLSGFAPATGHSVRIAYRFANGNKSVLSPAAVATTWGSDENLDGLPDDWQAGFWGDDVFSWPDPKLDSDGDGATNLQEFLAGTSPVNAGSVLRTSLMATPQGTFLHWNTQKGFVYQVQSKTDLGLEWADVGGPRFAAGTTDSMLIESGSASVYYRVKRLR